MGPKKAKLTLGVNNRLMDESSLAVVADLMDQWTREENTAYHQRLQDLQRLLHLLKLQVQRLEAEKTDYIHRLRGMAVIIGEQNDIIQDNVDSNVDWVPEVIWDAQNVPNIVVNLDPELGIQGVIDVAAIS